MRGYCCTRAVLASLLLLVTVAIQTQAWSVAVLPSVTTRINSRQTQFALYSTSSSDDNTNSTAIPPPPRTPTTKPRVVSSVTGLDPLVTSLTRMDEATRSAPSVKVPIWGDLILDKSLFIFVPVAVFAIGGIFLSLYVLANSGDAIVDAVSETTAAIPAASNEACRGLCSSQSDDLETLRNYMGRFAK